MSSRLVKIKLPREWHSKKWGKLIASKESDILGRGTYGTVFRATSETNPDIVKAVK